MSYLQSSGEYQSGCDDCQCTYTAQGHITCPQKKERIELSHNPAASIYRQVKNYHAPTQVGHQGQAQAQVGPAQAQVGPTHFAPHGPAQVGPTHFAPHGPAQLAPTHFAPHGPQLAPTHFEPHGPQLLQVAPAQLASRVAENFRPIDSSYIEGNSELAFMKELGRDGRPYPNIENSKTEGVYEDFGLQEVTRKVGEMVGGMFGFPKKRE